MEGRELTCLVPLMKSTRQGVLNPTGLVLPIGGVKEKVLAAHRAQITKIILPAQNKKDMEDVPEEPKRDHPALEAQ